MRERILVLLRPRESRGSSGFFLLPFVTVMSQLYIACSFSSPGGQRCRDGCYGDTLPSFCSASSNGVPDFRSSHTSLVSSFFYRRLPRAFWDSRTTLKRCSFVSETVSSSKPRRKRCYVLSPCLISLGKSKFSGSTAAMDFSSGVVAVFQISTF